MVSCSGVVGGVVEWWGCGRRGVSCVPVLGFASALGEVLFVLGLVVSGKVKVEGCGRYASAR